MPNPHPLPRADLGPRIHVKRDEESSIGRGCVLFGAHFRPEVAAIIEAMCRAVRKVLPGRLDSIELWMTEGWRDIRDTKDCHELCAAFDFVLRENGQPFKFSHRAVAHEASLLLGSDYDVLAHGEGANLHIHAEYDPDA